MFACCKCAQRLTEGARAVAVANEESRMANLMVCIARSEVRAARQGEGAAGWHDAGDGGWHSLIFCDHLPNTLLTNSIQSLAKALPRRCSRSIE